ncbi:pyrophosphatase, MutT/nudix family [Burkholderia pseudomallei Pasteur 52237]|nr:pyrophosphatase, MutT/nudix family [Burkholderia pseudomallei Pasteur 52237]
MDLDTRPSPHPPIRPFALRTAHGARRTADDAWRGRLPAFGRRAAADSVSAPSSRNAARQARRPIARRMPRSMAAPSGERLAARFFLFGATIWPYPFRAELDLIRRPIIDPEVLPIETTGADLPVVRPSSMTPAGLRERFAEPPEWMQEPAEAQLAHGVDPRSAAVLVPLVVRERGLTVLLTQRADHLNDHAGQISFPGGRREPDDRDANATALREAREEIALAHERVELLGALPDYLTGTGFCVTPVVGLVHPPFTVQPDTLEVAEIFEVPLDFLMNPAHHQIRVLRWEGGERRFFAMPYPRGPVGGQYFIWGATAGMLRNLYRFLSA